MAKDSLLCAGKFTQSFTHKTTQKNGKLLQRN